MRAPPWAVDGQDDRTTGGLLNMKFRGDWMCAESGHALEWAGLACGGRHSAALTRAGQVYTWGCDDAGQLGHGGNILQRLPTLLQTLVRVEQASRKSWRARSYGVPLDDGRELGCGETFTCLLTWSGEVWLWGRLGGRAYPRPSVIERLLDATIVGIACGTEHIAMVTGDASSLLARVDEVHTDGHRQEALEREKQSFEQHLVDDARAAEEAAAERAREKADRLAEKRRVKLLGRLAKQRAKQVGREERRREAEQAKAEAKAKEEQAKALGVPGEKKAAKGKKK